jgi:hypothetical protein
MTELNVAHLLLACLLFFSIAAPTLAAADFPLLARSAALAMVSFSVFRKAGNNGTQET